MQGQVRGEHRQLEEVLVRDQNAHRRTGKPSKAPGIAAVLLAILLTIRILVLRLVLR